MNGRFGSEAAILHRSPECLLSPRKRSFRSSLVNVRFAPKADIRFLNVRICKAIEEDQIAISRPISTT